MQWNARPARKAGKGVRQVVTRARKLRRSMTDCEQVIWHSLRRKQIEDFRFRRQRPIGKYIVDFICLEAKLIIELDGGQHAANVEYDDKRSQFLKSQGFSVLRFWNSDVMENLSGVLETIYAALLANVGDSSTNPFPRLPLAGEGADRASASDAAQSRAKAGRGARPVRAAAKNKAEKS